MRTEYYSQVAVRVVLAIVLFAYSWYCLMQQQVVFPSLSATQIVITKYYCLALVAMMLLAVQLIMSCLFYRFFERHKYLDAVGVGIFLCLSVSAILLG